MAKPPGKKASSKQPKMNKSTRTIDQTPVHDRTRLEALHDALTELMGNVNTIKDSYESIMNSLCTLHTRRTKRRKSASLVPATTSSLKQFKSSSRDAKQQMLEEYLNPLTRTQAFQTLFQQSEDLKTRLDSRYEDPPLTRLSRIAKRSPTWRE